MLMHHKETTCLKQEKSISLTWYFEVSIFVQTVASQRDTYGKQEMSLSLPLISPYLKFVSASYLSHPLECHKQVKCPLLSCPRYLS